ncbi:MAG: sodium/proline symporter PutP [Veillonella sp.]|uniref:sodium/proline symporter PutP n=1 Tax=Veillonella sp. TaxID=1926307 RepID=UPI00257CE6FC|nr:sodium/proline symporter PutP [Veillonella sp.]MBS6724553.1 sodium/proline symporter PutP [Veillonella sp.]MDU1261387.1 sodium/proline symporter PutP [Veillonella sp.]MDU7211949.1 sodium/proline symporter PutP [Veillonella sp.]
MTHNNIMIIIAFALYLGLMMYIGVYYYRKSNSIGDYILGGRQLGPWITALSAEASDMSGWMLMGVPGLAYTTGISGVWIAVGLTLGTWANWRFVSRRLRNHTEVASDSLTLPDYLKNRFHDQSHSVAVISALFILIFFLIYTSSGFVAGGKLFNTIFGLDYTVSLFITAGIVVFYTFLGGFLAVSWTDCIQGALMFFAILAVPITAAMYLGGPIDTMQLIQSEFPQGLNLWGDTSDMFSLVIGIISSLGWGLGYFGQPHILVRFMAISDAKELKKSTNIAMVWVILSLLAAIFVGLIGHVYMLPEKLVGTDAETIFLVMTERLFSPFMAGLIWSAVLAAIMSTASAQLLVTASAIANDFYANIIHKTATDKELVLVSRIVVLLVAAISIFLALNPDSLILTMVAYAWAGFGSAFGPAIIFSLFWKRMTRRGCIAGIVVGGLTVLIWKQFAFFGLYEIVPGFIFSSIAIYLVSIFDKLPPRPVLKDYKEAEKLHIL